jgi:hypothetical protein
LELITSIRAFIFLDRRLAVLHVLAEEVFGVIYGLGT